MFLVALVLLVLVLEQAVLSCKKSKISLSTCKLNAMFEDKELERIQKVSEQRGVTFSARKKTRTEISEII